MYTYVCYDMLDTPFPFLYDFRRINESYWHWFETVTSENEHKKYHIHRQLSTVCRIPVYKILHFFKTNAYISLLVSLSRDNIAFKKNK